jgi:hypothetical protein
MNYFCRQCVMVIAERQVERLGNGPQHRLITAFGPDIVHGVSQLPEDVLAPLGDRSTYYWRAATVEGEPTLKVDGVGITHDPLYNQRSPILGEGS